MESYTVGRNAERRRRQKCGKTPRAGSSYLPARAVAALPYNRAG